MLPANPPRPAAPVAGAPRGDARPSGRHAHLPRPRAPLPRRRGGLALAGAAGGLAARAVRGGGRIPRSVVRRRSLSELLAAREEDDLPSSLQFLKKEELRAMRGARLRAAYDTVLRMSPVLIAALCTLAYAFFPEAADVVSTFSFSNFDLKRGRPVADQVLTSVVVPGLGILFATLASSTLSVLRARQQDMRKSLRQEAILLDNLAKPLRRLFRGRAELKQAFFLMEQYAICVVVETEDSSIAEEQSRVFNVQRMITSAMLDLIGKIDDELVASGNSTNAIVMGRVVGFAQAQVNRLDNLRASRRSSTFFTFPLLHWAILLFLAFSLPVSALILASTFQDTSPEVYSDQLVRLLIAIITGAPLLLLSLLADLNEPYAGYVRLTEEPAAFEDTARNLREEMRRGGCGR